MVNDTINDSYLGMFVFETSQLIEQLEHIILNNEVENSFCPTTINEIFRIMHTIKGSAAMMMCNNISSLAHSMEDIFFYLRDNKQVTIDNSALSDLIFEVIDFIKEEVVNINNGEISDGDVTELITRLNVYLFDLKGSNNTVIKKEDIILTDHFKISHKQLDTDPSINNIYKAVVFFSDGCGMENIRAYGIIHNLIELTEELYYLPENLIEDDKNSERIIKEGFTIYFKSNKSMERLQEFFQQIIFLKDLELVQLDNEYEINQFKNQSISELHIKNEAENYIVDHLQSEMKDTDILSKEIHQSKLQQNFISVNVSKLDKLLDLVGEMVITEAMVINNPDLKDLELDNFQKSAHQLSKITSEIKDMVMSIRMVPLSTTFHKMHRIVRDMCKRLDKEVQLQIIGEETEVDKNIIEHISDPLMHLIRNAVDHGIENAIDRQSLGKSTTGTITIEAKNAGSDVLIIVSDDGKGLNKEKILKKARENKLLISPEEHMTDKEIYHLVLLPGFSTKEDVTEFSGRGVGMDVVTKNIESISGSLSLDCIPDKGTTVTIKIPLTLAIIDAMNIKVGNAYYSIPTMSIQESFRPKENDLITDPDGAEMIMIRGRCYPITRLHKIYNVPTRITEFTDGIFIMIQQEGKSLCIFADELIGQQQIVVKSLPKYISSVKRINGISGCTLLGDGSISLILDLVALVNN
jgi:two-component system chemotaxis sensor kinase CheA